MQLFLPLLVLLLATKQYAQNNQGNAYVDQNGIIRWKANKEEIHGFGVNYTAPFAHAYRLAQKKDIDIKKEIDKDIYHFTRLGFDLYRIHVWDTEISDEQGNLLENEHLDIFDYLLKQLKDRGINFVLTPIAYWGNGWPEPDEDTPGFSDKYGKEKSLTDPDAIKAQQNYLTQFMNHVNKYTGVAYKNEPNLIAVEISNEPHHRGTKAQVTEFIRKMVNAIQKTGAKKPIFYNVSHSIHLADAYFDAGIDGGTFQWYPTGLGFGKELEGNLLPNVNDYHIPFEDVIKEHHAAKIVYEFDAADVLKSYIYPAIARSFRTAGIQLATHFAYDPTFLAYANTEYNTHYMNLNYVPHKALGLMIASEIFHKIPMYSDFGEYPDNLEFGDFKISYEGDVATYNSEEKFIYTNSNDEQPKNLKKLKGIAGHGSSQIVKYEGKGAYFLDKIKKGVWRLEVMPDPVIVKNPFGKNSLDKTVAVISWKSNEMNVKLPDLHENFMINGINKGNDFIDTATGLSFSISPGVYILKNPGATFKDLDFNENHRFKIDEFVAKENTVDKTYLVHEPLKTSEAGREIELNATVVSNEEVEKVEVWLQNGNMYDSVELEAKNNYDYSAKVPQKLLNNGFMNYRIIVTTKGGKFTFPGGVAGSPADWDFHSSEEYQTKIMKVGSPIYLFNAATDSDKMVREWRPENEVVPIPGNEAEFQVKLEKLFMEDIENKNAEPVYDYSFRYNFSEKTLNRSLTSKNELVLKARALGDKTEKLQVALVMKNGAAFGTVVELSPEIEEITIPLSELKPVKTVTLPRPYPGFLPYYFEHSNESHLKMQDVEAVQFSIGPGISKDQLQQPHAIGIRSLYIN
ncbi:membrane or secreted protein [Christiangramia fulva]|uniref:Membrane or secreted protein n=1 Tax=Christiangramia fulva TaxID=2126553 RepID=A0A2R3Z9Q2_9FLAO|nr:membrane or secreted protein [Christiangramia fulva]